MMCDFRPIERMQPNPLFRNRPGPDEPYLEACSSDGFACFVRKRAMMQMTRWGRAAGRKEVIGHLAGRLCEDGKGPYALVEGATLNREARCGPAFVHSDIPAQQAARRRFERRYRALEQVGWWHTHPSGLGLFYSPTDRQNQATWEDPSAIGIVLDPSLRDEALKVFRGPESDELIITRRSEIARMTRSIRIRLDAKNPGSKVERCEPAVAFRADFQRKGLPSAASTQGNWKVGVTVAICISACSLLFAVLTHVFTWNETVRTANLRQSVLNLKGQSGESYSFNETIDWKKNPMDQANGATRISHLSERGSLIKRHKSGSGTKKPNPDM